MTIGISGTRVAVVAGMGATWTKAALARGVVLATSRLRLAIRTRANVEEQYRPIFSHCGRWVVTPDPQRDVLAHPRAVG